MIPYAAFKREKVMKGDLPLRVYGTLGDALLQKRVVDALIEWSLPADARDWNFDALDGESATISDVLSRASNVPFLAERRVVHVARAEKLENINRAGDSDEAPKSKGKSAKLSPAKRLIEGLKTLPPSTVLILSRTPETPEVGARKTEKRCLNAAIDKVLEDKIGVIIDCLIDPKNAQLPIAMVENEATARGIVLERGAAAHLVQRAGNDLALLFSELEKCSLRVGNGETVTRAVIEEMVKRASQETVFDLTDALGERKTARAIALTRELLGNGEPPELVMTLLVRHFRQLLQARALLDARVPLDGTASNRLPPALSAQFPSDSILKNMNWLGPRLGAQARQFTTPQLQRALQLCFETDLAMKGIEGDGGLDGKGQPELLFELLITQLA